MSHVARGMAKGAAWMVAARFCDRLIGLVSTVILARLLVPADFGLVVMATAIAAALQLLTAFSFDLALIQKPNAERQHYDTVWTLGVIFSAALALALLLLGQPAAQFYNEPRLIAVMQVLALSTLLEGFTNVGIVAFRKEMQFEKEFKFLFSKKLAAVSVTIILAFVWRNYWALVVGTMAGSFAALTLSYLWHPYRPHFSLSALKELFSFSRWLFVNNTLGFFYHRAADFILAKGVGPGGLGQYSIAYEIANLPSSELVAPVNRAVFPGYAKMLGDVGYVRAGFINVISLVGLFAIPAAVGLACLALPIVELFLGPKWVPMAPLVQVLAINGILTAIWSCSGYVYLALGRPRNITIVLSAHLALSLPLMAAAAFHWHVLAVTWALLFASIMIVPLNYALLSNAIGVTAGNLVSVMWRPVLGSLVMAVAVMSAIPYVGFSNTILGEILSLFALVSYGAASYCATVIILWLLSSRPEGAESFVLNRVRGLIRQLRSANENAP